MPPDLLAFWLVSENIGTGLDRLVQEPEVLCASSLLFRKKTFWNKSWVSQEMNIVTCIYSQGHVYNPKYVFNIGHKWIA